MAYLLFHVERVYVIIDFNCKYRNLRRHIIELIEVEVFFCPHQRGLLIGLVIVATKMKNTMSHNP